jgi:hypothetical protein
VVSSLVCLGFGIVGGLMAKIRNMKKGPEALIQGRLILKLRSLQWSVRETHGNLYQFGFPDLYCCHLMYGTRWVEVKTPNRGGDVFTQAQHIYFRELLAHGVGVWVLTGDEDSEIAKLHRPANWTHFLH